MINILNITWLNKTIYLQIKCTDLQNYVVQFIMQLQRGVVKAAGLVTVQDGVWMKAASVM